MSYNYLNHGADIGIEVNARSREDLFRESGEAVFAFMVDLDGVRLKESHALNLEGSDLQELLYEWLSELVSLSSLKNTFYREFPKLEIHEKQTTFTLEAEAAGERIDPQRHSLGTEIKAITYQGLNLTQERNRWRCTFVVDV